MEYSWLAFFTFQHFEYVILLSPRLRGFGEKPIDSLMDVPL